MQDPDVVDWRADAERRLAGLAWAHERDRDLYEGRLGDGALQHGVRAALEWLAAEAGGDVVDVACGQGTAALLCARRGCHVVACEQRPALLAVARTAVEEEPERIVVHDAAPERLPVGDAAVDTVVCRDVLTRVDDPGAVLAEAARVLKPGGRLLCAEPFGAGGHPEHRRTFQPTDLLVALAPHAAAEDLRVEHGWMLVAGERHRHGQGEPSVTRDAVATILRQRRSLVRALEDAFDRAERAAAVATARGDEHAVAVDELGRALAEERARAAQLDRALAERTAKHAHQRERVSELKDELKRQRREVDRLQAKRGRLTAQLGETKAALAGARAELRALRATRWWRLGRLLGAPLRRVRRRGD